MNIRIPEFNQYTHCPKCNSPVGEFGSVTFHNSSIRRYDAPLEDEWPCGVLLYVNGDDEELRFELNKGHLCKKCRFCGFGWVERSFSEGSVYEYRPCGCDHHGDHAGCDESCECAR